MNRLIKTIPCLFFVVLSPPLLHAQGVLEQQPNPAMAGNLLKNGDMSDTIGWQGDHTYSNDGITRVLMIRADKSVDRVFSQDITVDQVKDLVLRFGYKTADYKGGGVMVKIQFQDHTTLSKLAPKADNQWHIMQFDDSKVSGKSVTVEFDIKPGAGVIYFDGIIAKDKSAF